jgi:ATP-dependent RNA helicase RhlE
VLVFTRTKHRAKKLAMQLIKSGASATSLQGNLSQNRRQEAMDGFRSGRVKVMVATDIAARGIDVTQITHVINYDMPDTAEAYTHRIGRTGRMERLGSALTLVTQADLPMLRTIERLIGRKLERREVSGRAAPIPPANGQARPPERGDESRPANARPMRGLSQPAGRSANAARPRPVQANHSQSRGTKANRAAWTKPAEAG